MTNVTSFKAFKLERDLKNPRLSGRHSSGWQAIEMFPAGTVFAVREKDGELDLGDCWFAPNTGSYLGPRSKPMGRMAGIPATVQALLDASVETGMTVDLVLATMEFTYADLGRAIADQGAIDAERAAHILSLHEFRQMAEDADDPKPGPR